MLTSDSVTIKAIPPVGKFRVKKLRWGSERRTLWLTLLAILATLFLFTTFSWGTFALVVGGSLVFSWLITRLRHSGLIGGAVKVTDQQVPRLAQIFQECAWRIRPPLMQGFVVQSPIPGAYSFGLTAPQAVVLHSGVIDLLDEGELRFVIGHEMGHIAFQHTRLSSLLGGLAGVPGAPILSALAALAFLAWSRCAVFSANRAGVAGTPLALPHTIAQTQRRIQPGRRNRITPG